MLILKILSRGTFEVQTTLHNNPNTLKDASEADLKRYTRWLAFWSSRIDQTGSIGNSLSYFQQFANSNPDLFTGQTTKWIKEGPFENPSAIRGRIGRANSLWVNPNNENHILLGSGNGGLWQTFNNGQENN